MARKRAEGEGENYITNAGGLRGYLLAKVFVGYEIEKSGAQGLFRRLTCQSGFRDQPTHVPAIDRIDQARRLPNQSLRRLAQRANGLRSPELDDNVGHFGRRLTARIMRTVGGV